MQKRTRMCHVAMAIRLTRRWVRLFVLSLFALFASVPGNTATITVCPSGCDETSITAAVAAADSGDTVSVSSGVWYENFAIQKSITILGAGSDQTIIDGGGIGSVILILDPSMDVEVSLEHLSIRNGRAEEGGGIRMESTSNLTTVVISDCVLSENNAWAASGKGGAILAEGSAVSLFIYSSSIRNNQSDGSGGGIRASRIDQLHIEDSTFAENTIGAISIHYVNPFTLSNVDVISNTGYGVSLFGTVETEITNCRFEENVGTAIFVGQYAATISKCSFRRNSSERRGAAISASGALGVSVSQSAFHGNVSESGGAIFIASSTWAGFENVTISGNSTSAGDCGAILNYGSMSLSFSTVAFNQSFIGNVGGICNYKNLYVDSSIVSNNTGNNCEGAFNSDGYNIDDDGSCGFGEIGDVSGVSPELLPPTDQGDYRYFHAVPEHSIAVDASFTADPPSVDQRGAPRPMDGNNDEISVPDIGAYEFPDDTFWTIFSDGFESGDTTAWTRTVP